MKLKNLYDDLYINNYHKQFGFSHSKHLMRYIKEHNKEGDKILDVGCSIGSAILLLENLKMDAHGIDISEVAINIAKKKFKNCKQGYAEEIPYEDNYFDAILSTQVIEHLPPENIDKCFGEFKRVVKLNGLFYLQIGKKLEINRKWQNVVKKHGYRNLHLTVQSGKIWLNYFKEKNIQLVKITKNNKLIIEVILKNLK